MQALRIAYRLSRDKYDAGYAPYLDVLTAQRSLFAAEQSLGRLFLAAIGPALLLVTLFAAYAMWQFRREHRRAKDIYERTGVHSELLQEDKLTTREKFALLPRVLPFVILLTGVMFALYGGYATPSETAGLAGFRPQQIAAMDDRKTRLLIMLSVSRSSLSSS